MDNETENGNNQSIEADGFQGGGEQRTEAYDNTVKGVTQSTTPKAADNSDGIAGSASKQGAVDNELGAMRHSLAHIMATAITSIWPEVKLGVGPVVENGFYYDVDIPNVTISEDDFKRIEEAMRQVVNQKQPFVQSSQSIAEAIEWAKSKNQPYKEELLNDLSRAGTTVAKDLSAEEMGTLTSGESQVDSAGFYTNGEFTDLCRGPHVEHTGMTGAFKLMRVAGAYWRGKETNPQMQRLYGVAFETKEELENHLLMLEEAKKRDHRKIGKEMELFLLHETAPGMPYWLPKGTIVYNELINFWREEHQSRGYQEIISPLINKKELYVTSGHFDHYWEEMFTTEETEEGEHYGMKAMNCPNAMIVFGSRNRSYRELPLRLSDTDTLHRFERSGTLNGLLRVREFRQDDAHIFVSEDQIEEEYAKIFEITELFYSIFDMDYSFRLGTRPEKFMGDEKLWDRAEDKLKKILDNSGKEYYIEEGDGAFYGPKIDIVMKDALGRPWQMGTIQLDFQQPIRFDLKYTGDDGKEQTPIVIHRVIYGSLERFIGVLIEHTAGNFPIWLAPEQVRIITVNQEEMTIAKAQEIADMGKKHGLRVYVDNANESVGKKIRLSATDKVPYTLVIGEREINDGVVSPRLRHDIAVIDAQSELHYEQFVQTVANEAKARVNKSSL